MPRQRRGILSKQLWWPRANNIAPEQVQAQEGLGRFLALTGGLPRAIGARDTRDEAIRLLRVAAEVEHALLVEYLYAAFLLGPDADPIYQQSLVTVAIQEMGHLITVQNLLCLLGAPPHLDRDELLPASAKQPGAFLLEALTPESLAKYVVIESPLDEVIQAAPAAWAIYKKAVSKIDNGSMMQLNRVGALYAAIYWLFMENDEPEPNEPWRLDPALVLRGKNAKLKGVHLKPEDFRSEQEIVPFLAVPNEWRVMVESTIVYYTTNRQTAKEALFKISSQGEGVANDPASKSHFQRFLELFNAAEKNPPVVITPPTAKLPSSTKAARSKVAECSNVRYQILLLLIDLTLRTPNTAPSRARLSKLAIDEMQTGVKAFTESMLQLTGAPTNGPVAPTFVLPSVGWPNDELEDAPSVKVELRELLTRSEQVNHDIRASWPDLMEEDLSGLDRLNSRIDDVLRNG